MDKKLADMFKSKVATPVKITQAVQYGLIILGTLIALCVVSFMIKECAGHKRKIPYKNMDVSKSEETDSSRTTGKHNSTVAPAID